MMENPGAAAVLERRHRFQWWELLPWAAGIAMFFAFPNYLSFGTQLLVTILFALSLDLVLGYAGIVTLGHAAFFGAGAYTVGMMAQHLGWNEPLSGLLAAGLVAGAIGLVSGFVLLRTHGLTLLMLTLCTMTLLEQAANMGHHWTGGFDGMPSLTFQKILGLFSFDVLYFKSQYLYALSVLALGFVLVRTLIYSSFGQSLTGIRENLLRMHAVGAPVRGRLIVVYAISAALAGVSGGLFAQVTGYVNLAVLGLERAAGVLIILILGGHGRLYGAFVGAVAYLVLEHLLAKAYPTAWQLGLGLTLVAVALFARGGLIGLFDRLRGR
jgi:branched-chain amino acid transport system permease protein